MLLIAVASCAPPRISALPGAVAPNRNLPRGALAEGYRKVVFEWELRDGDVTARGDGVARIAPPDSVRMDFFLGGERDFRPVAGLFLQDRAQRGKLTTAHVLAASDFAVGVAAAHPGEHLSILEHLDPPARHNHLHENKNPAA